MTDINHDAVDEDLLLELGLGKPTLEGEDWNLENVSTQDTPPEDFMQTLDALKLLQDLGEMELKQTPPQLDPPQTDGNDLIAELLNLLQQPPPDSTAPDNPELPQLDPPTRKG